MVLQPHAHMHQVKARLHDRHLVSCRLVLPYHLCNVQTDPRIYFRSLVVISGIFTSIAAIASMSHLRAQVSRLLRQKRNTKK